MKNKIGGKTLAAVNVSLLALLACFAWTTVYSSDDYWYSTFWDGGLARYWELMVYHYQSFNGRMLVHALAHIILHFGSWAYVTVCCGQVLVGVWSVAEKGSFSRVLWIMLTGVLCMPRAIFDQGLMWISASCNYLFPVILICLLVRSHQNGSRWAYLLAFLCGATTEQMGLTATVLCGVYTLAAILRRKDILPCVACTGLSLAGVMTIFLSPATRLRMEKNVRLEGMDEIIDLFRRNILREADMLTENPAPLIVMVAVLALAAWFLWRRGGLKWPAAVAAIGALGLTAGSLGGDQVCLWGYCIGFVALALLGWLLLLRGEGSGGLILAGLLSAAAVLTNRSIEARLLMPVYLGLVLALCGLESREAPKLDRIAVPALVLTVAAVLPAVRGYWYNYQIDLQNRDYAREDRDKAFVRYCTDYDMEYTWKKADFDGYFRGKYLESIGLPKTAAIRFFSGADPQERIFCGQTELASLAVHLEDGTVMLPLREVVESLGGSLDTSGTAIVVEISGRTFELTYPDGASVLVTWNEGQFSGRRSMEYAITYCDSDVFSEAFGLHIHWDEAWYITK